MLYEVVHGFPHRTFSVSLGSVATLSVFPRVRSISKLNPVSAHLILTSLQLLRLSGLPPVAGIGVHGSGLMVGYLTLNNLLFLAITASSAVSSFSSPPAMNCQYPFVVSLKNGYFYLFVFTDHERDYQYLKLSSYTDSFLKGENFI